MSLFDALFLDPHPLNIWVAVRADRTNGSGDRGSGTASDPYDASPKLAVPPQKITLNRTNNSNVAVAAVAAGHGLQNSNTVQIQGAQEPTGETVMTPTPLESAAKLLGRMSA